MINESSSHLVATLGSFIATLSAVGVRFFVGDFRSRLDHLEKQQSEMVQTLARLDERTKLQREQRWKLPQT